MTRKMLYGFAISLLFAPTGVVAQDADSIARSMSNPTAAVSGLASSLDFTTYTGALPEADARTGWSYQLQPVFPFPLESGANILFRPAIPIIFDRPVSDGTGFEGSGITSDAGAGSNPHLRCMTSEPSARLYSVVTRYWPTPSTPIE